MTCAHLDFVGDIARVTLDHPTGNRINFAIMTLQGEVMQLAERIGRTKAIEVVMLSEPLPAEQLPAWNIANRVVDDRALAASAETFAERLTANLARTNAATKELLSQWRNKGYRHAKDALYGISMPLFDVPDVQARLVAAAEGMRESSK